MKNKLTILGCGSSLGSPWITNYWGSCNKDKIKNRRTRCSAHIQFKNMSILIDTSPDLKMQLIKNKIKNVDSIIYTHEHADQTSGIFELRPFFWKNKKRIPIYGSKKTISELKKTFNYCFVPRHGYVPILTANLVNRKFRISKKKNYIDMQSFEVEHGDIKSTAYIFKNIAYLSDCNSIPKKYLKFFKNLDYLIIDCLRNLKHRSHFNYDDAIYLSKYLKPKKTILTNLHVDLDYFKLKKRLPKNIIPAFDGLNFSF